MTTNVFKCGCIREQQLDACAELCLKGGTTVVFLDDKLQLTKLLGGFIPGCNGDPGWMSVDLVEKLSDFAPDLPIAEVRAWHRRLQDVLQSGKPIDEPLMFINLKHKYPAFGARFFRVWAIKACGGVAIRLRDVTDEQQQRTAIEAHIRDLAIAKIRAEEADRVKSDFLAKMSHELRTPLTGIIGACELIPRNINREVADLTETINVCGEHMLRVVDEILGLVKATNVSIQLLDAVEFNIEQDGKQRDQRDTFDVRRLVTNIVRMTSGDATRQGNRLVSFVDPFVPENVVGDLSSMTKVLLNLVSNANRFTQKGEIAIHVSLNKPTGSNLEFAVSDTGIGIRPEDQSRIFEPFVQAETKATTRQYNGTGLGLAIVKSLVSQMAGKIEVASQVGRGSVFTVSVPILPQTPTPIETTGATTVATTQQSIGKPMNEQRRIMVVDDNEVNRKIMSKMLQRVGVLASQIQLFASGPDALAEATSTTTATATAPKPDLCLLDYHMPGMDGIELADRLCKLWGDIKIVIVTADKITDFDKYVVVHKPLTVDTLRSLVAF